MRTHDAPCYDAPFSISLTRDNPVAILLIGILSILSAVYLRPLSRTHKITTPSSSLPLLSSLPSLFFSHVRTRARLRTFFLFLRTARFFPSEI